MTACAWLSVGRLSPARHQPLCRCRCSKRTIVALEVTLFSASADDARRCANACKRRPSTSSTCMVLMPDGRRDPRAPDILVDVKGATYGSVMQVMAHRPAPGR
jgi:hypothetical protein